MRVLNLVFYTQGKIQTDSIWEEGADEVIWA